MGCAWNKPRRKSGLNAQDEKNFEFAHGRVVIFPSS
jgi:hypothetical protein